MPLIEDLKKLFGTEDLYEVLSVSKDANESELKKAYYRKSLLTHPDRASDDNKASSTEKFKALSKVYALLSDKEKRAVYDDTGEVDDDAVDLEGGVVRDWLAYWRRIYKGISEEDVENFRRTYQKSQEEMDDLKAAYVAYEGDMDRIMDAIMCSNPLVDEDRFRETIDEWIRKDIVTDFPSYGDQEKRALRKARAEKEAEEAKEAAKEIGLDASNTSLEAAIQEKAKKREGGGFLDKLAEKYGGGAEKEKETEESDEAMEAAEVPVAPKRKRERAKREVAKGEPEEEEEEEEEEVPKKRRRGRPKKYEKKVEDSGEEWNDDDDDDDDEEEEEEDEDDEDDGDEDYSKPKPKRAQRKSKDGGGKQKRGTPVKRGRGRPRKVQQKTGGDGGNSAVKKRGRGRPRKAK